jgi:hypothetical protein
MPAHSVGNDEERVLGEHHITIFIVLALPTYVAQPGSDRLHPIALPSIEQ